MALRRIFVESTNGTTTTVSGDRAHHLSRVVRLREGERVEVSDQQRVFEAVTKRCSGRLVEFEIESELPTPSLGPPFVAAIAIHKFARLEWAIEKLTELGVTAIQPLVAARTEKGLAAAAEKRLDRWRRITFEAAQQSRRVSAPAVHPPQSFQATVAAADSIRSVVFDIEGPPLDHGLSIGALTFFVGPEGGWTETERQLAVDAGIASVGLGPLVLRAETAAISAAAICLNQRCDANR